MAVFRDALADTEAIRMGPTLASYSIGPPRPLAQPARRCVRRDCSALRRVAGHGVPPAGPAAGHRLCRCRPVDHLVGRTL